MATRSSTAPSRPSRSAATCAASGSSSFARPARAVADPTRARQPSAALRDVTYTLSGSGAAGGLRRPAAACSRAPFRRAPRRSATTPPTRAAACAACSSRSTARRRGPRAARAGSLTGSACPSSPARRRSPGRSSLTRPQSPGATGATWSRVCVEDLSSDSRRCTPSASVLVLNGCADQRGAAATMSLGWRGKRGVVRSRQGARRTATRQALRRRSRAVSRGPRCASRAASRPIAPAPSGCSTGPRSPGPTVRRRLKVRGQSSRFVRATYFAGPEQVITKRIRLNVSPAVRLGIRRAAGSRRATPSGPSPCCAASTRPSGVSASTSRGPAATSSPATRLAPEVGARVRL